VVIELLDQFREGIAKRDEVDHVAILIEISANFRFESIVVAVQAFANITRKGDKMR